MSLVVCLAWSPVALATTASDDQAQALAATAANHGLKPPEPPAVISRDEEGRTIVRALRLTERLRMDGTLDESVYQTVPPITGLFQQVPDQGAPATEKTEMWVMFDADNIYVAARCWDSASPDQWVANDYRRDSSQMRQNDTFGLSLDTFFDRRSGFIFYTNPLGARVDYAVIDRVPNFDWNPVWDARPGRFDGGWTVEIQIPFTSLRYKSGPGQLWGLQLRRVVRRKNEWSYLTHVPQAFLGPNALTQVAYTSTLVGLELPDANRNVELKPYGITRTTTDRTKTPAVSNDPDAAFGMDAKYSVTASMTADFTYNTDFAQVEVDEQQVNLTRFSLVFPEKREFFLEGRGLFDFARGGGSGTGGSRNIVPNLFFTRRIGIENGLAVAVTFGSRLTGKVNRTGVGVLNIETGDEPLVNATATNFTVLRLKQDVLRRSTIGAIVTHRSNSVVAPGSNQAYGLDTSFNFYDSLNLSAYYAKTQTPGFKGEDTSYQARFAYDADRYGATVDQLFVGRNFNPEVGYLQRSDFRRGFGYLRFSPRPRSIPRVRKFTMDGSVEYIVNGAGAVETRGQQARFITEFNSGDQLTVQANSSYELLEAPLTIGPNVKIPVDGYQFSDLEIAYLLGAQHRANGAVSVQHGNFYSGTISALNVSSARVGITPRLSFEPGVTINRIDLPEGKFTTQLLRLRTDYAFSARMFASAFLQYNSDTERFNSNLRFRWEYRPGSEFFLVYTDEHNTQGSHGVPSLRNRAFVVKINRLFRF